jgi:molecular chaperone DnaK
MSAKRVYGIDLGTTYSCIAYVDEHGKPVVLANSEGEATTPSVVYFEKAGQTVVGQPAKDAVPVRPDLCVATVKRAMGDAHFERTFHGQTFRPQDISSFILRKLARDAEKITGDKVEDVVITCPAYFGTTEKEATKQAGVLAGLNVHYVIPEPTAAALAYGIDQTEDQVILVYDLGGGTFDVTLIEIKTGAITVLCTGGDRELGGKDWDDVIVRFFAAKFAEATGTSADKLLDDTETYQELLAAAEKCKKALSSRDSVVEAVRFDADREKVELTRAEFDRLTLPLLERTLSLTQQEVDKVRAKGYSRIDKLLLVGGSTYMPQVIDAVKARFRMDVRQFDPNQAVAKGAAIFGYKCHLDEEIKRRLAGAGQAAADVDLGALDPAQVEKAQSEVARAHGMSLGGLKQMVEKKITNVTSKTFGLVVWNKADREVVWNLIERDSPVPCSLTETFETREEGQVQVDLRCMESTLAGERESEVASCNGIGSTVLVLGGPLPKGAPLEVTFTLGPDGLLMVHGKDLTGGTKVDAKFETAAILSQEEVAVAKSRNLALNVA